MPGLSTVLVVLDHDAEDKTETSASGEQKAEDSQARITKEPKGSLDRHEQGCTDDQRSKDDPHGDAIRDFLESRQEVSGIGCFDLHLQFPVADGIENLIQAVGKSSDKI